MFKKAENQKHLKTWALEGFLPGHPIVEFSRVVAKRIFPGGSNSGETSFYQLRNTEEKFLFKSYEQNIIEGGLPLLPFQHPFLERNTFEN